MHYEDYQVHSTLNLDVFSLLPKLTSGLRRWQSLNIQEVGNKQSPIFQLLKFVKLAMLLCIMYTEPISLPWAANTTHSFVYAAPEPHFQTLIGIFKPVS